MVDSSRILVTVLAITVVLGAFGPVLVGAQEGDQGEEGGEVDVSGVAAVLVLLVGTVILMASVELLIQSLMRTATKFGVSAFVLAVIFSGWEFDNIAFGVFTGFREMQNVAFGLAIGNAISIFGLTLALGAIIFPFKVDVPRDYLLLTVAAPILLVPILLAGSIAPTHGVLFVLAYVVVFGYVVRRERQMGRAFLRSDEVQEATTSADGDGDASHDLPEFVGRFSRHGWFWPAMMLVAIGGIVVGAESSATGVEGILDTWQLTGTFLGVSIITIIYTLDDLLLIIEPLRLGYYDIAVGGVIGSLLFFVTANVGIIGLVGEITFRPETAFLHFPALLTFAALSSYFLWRGRMTRWNGGLLLGLYLLYLLVNIQFFAVAPVGE